MHETTENTSHTVCHNHSILFWSYFSESNVAKNFFTQRKSQNLMQCADHELWSLEIGTNIVTRGQQLCEEKDKSLSKIDFAKTWVAQITPTSPTLH